MPDDKDFWKPADSQFEYKHQPYHGGGDTDGSKLRPVPAYEDERDRYQDDSGRLS